MIMHEVKVKPKAMPKHETLRVENDDGLKWAVVFNDESIVGIFDNAYWARYFVERANLTFTIREIVED